MKKNQQTHISIPNIEDTQNWAFQAMKAQFWALASQRWALVRQSYPNNAPAWIQGSIAHINLKEYEIAKNLLIEAEQKFPENINVQFQQVELACRMGNWQEAENKAFAMQEKFPQEPQCLQALTQVSLETQDFQKADEFNQQACDSFPDNLAIWRQFLDIAEKQEDWSLLLERSTLFLNHFPDERMGYHFLVLALEKLGDLKKAKVYRQAMVYGKEWLEQVQVNEEEEPTAIKPPARRNFMVFLDLVWTKARLNLKSEASRDSLRYLWWVIDPLLHMVVFYIVFTFLFHRGGGVEYLLTGIIPFQWFAKTIQQSSGSLLQGKGLMNQVKISPLFFPFVVSVQNFGKQMLVFALLFIFIACYSTTPSLNWLGVGLVIFIQFIFMLALGAFFSLLVPFVRDLLKLIPTGIQFTMFVSGIFFPVDRLPEKWHTLFFCNPMASLLAAYRSILLDNQLPDMYHLIIPLIYTVVLGIGIFMIYRKFGASYAKVVL